MNMPLSRQSPKVKKNVLIDWMDGLILLRQDAILFHLLVIFRSQAVSLSSFVKMRELIGVD